MNDKVVAPKQTKAPVKSTVAKPTVAKKEIEVKEECSIIQKMMNEINETEDKIDFDGKKYTTVAKRNEILRRHLGFNVKVITEALKVESDVVIFSCSISVKEDGEWVQVATGHSEEHRSSSEINKKAALENAETSAIGRALANLGLSGGEYASINEIKTKNGGTVSAIMVKHLKSVIKDSGLTEKNLLSVYSLKSFEQATPEVVFKIMDECLKTISKKEELVTKSNKEAASEDDISL